jgi:seryl-tRNA synthetase
MKFLDMYELFNDALIVKYQYPFIISYVQYLKSLNIKQQNKEIKLFNSWLKKQKQLLDKDEFDDEQFQTGNVYKLNMNKFITVDNFVNRLKEMYKELLQQRNNISDIIDSIEDDNIKTFAETIFDELGDTFEQLLNKNDDINFSDIVNNPEIFLAIDNILKKKEMFNKINNLDALFNTINVLLSKIKDPSKHTNIIEQIQNIVENNKSKLSNNYENT